jgi:hypothetical protein
LVPPWPIARQESELGCEVSLCLTLASVCAHETWPWALVPLDQMCFVWVGSLVCLCGFAVCNGLRQQAIWICNGKGSWFWGAGCIEEKQRHKNKHKALMIWTDSQWISSEACCE